MAEVPDGDDDIVLKADNETTADGSERPMSVSSLKAKGSSS